MAALKLFENTAETNPALSPKLTLVLAHGAGAPADSEFMRRLAEALASLGISTFRFEFPYMARRRADGRKRPPDRQPLLLSHFREVIRQVRDERRGHILVGGKSMGGRMASLLAADPAMAGTIDGCLCFGYPFHPPAKPENWRVEHFDRFHCPVLIVQGTRDPFGKRPEVEECPAVSESTCNLFWLEGGNHDFSPLARQPETQGRLIVTAAEAAAVFVAGSGYG